jgi:hypothetical protein
LTGADEKPSGNSIEHWYELRLANSAPERRSYHSTFVYDNKMYVMGGLDIQNGSMNSLWELDLN